MEVMEKQGKNMKIKTLSASFLLVALLAACGQKETIIREVVVTQPTLAPAPTEPPYTPDKYDLYLDEVYTYSAQARSWAEQDLLEFGMTVCDAFDDGATLDSVIGLFSEYSSGSYDDELFAGVLGAAVIHICPEHRSYIQSQLGT